MKRSRSKPVDPKLPGRYGRMTARQLDREVAKFDREFIADESRPLTRRQLAEERAARRRGRPRIGLGSQKVMITLERRLLRETDQCAKKLGVSRAALIARALKSVLKKTG